MYKKITNTEGELLFTHQQQTQLQPPNPLLLDPDRKAEQYIANTFPHINQQGIYGIMLSSQQNHLETRQIENASCTLNQLTKQTVLSHMIQTSALRIIVVHHNPTSTNLFQGGTTLLDANILKMDLLEYSLLLDDIFIINKAQYPTQANENKHRHNLRTTSLARMGLV